MKPNGKDASVETPKALRGKEQLLRALKITLFMIGRERECFEN